MATPAPTSFAGLLQRAVTDPGTLSRAYRQFHQYSLGNQLLAWSQCLEREIPPGPMATYPRCTTAIGVARPVSRGRRNTSSLV